MWDKRPRCRERREAGEPVGLVGERNAVVGGRGLIRRRCRRRRILRRDEGRLAGRLLLRLTLRCKNGEIRLMNLSWCPAPAARFLYCSV